VEKSPLGGRPHSSALDNTTVPISATIGNPAWLCPVVRSNFPPLGCARKLVPHCPTCEKGSRNSRALSVSVRCSPPSTAGWLAEENCRAFPIPPRGNWIELHRHHLASAHAGCQKVNLSVVASGGSAFGRPPRTPIEPLTDPNNRVWWPEVLWSIPDGLWPLIPGVTPAVIKKFGKHIRQVKRNLLPRKHAQACAMFTA